jgi:hypothetical protein
MAAYMRMMMQSTLNGTMNVSISTRYGVNTKVFQGDRFVLLEQHHINLLEQADADGWELQTEQRLPDSSAINYTWRHPDAARAPVWEWRR